MDNISEKDYEELMNCSDSTSVIEEQLEKINNKLKLFEVKLKNKSLKFAGYEDLENTSTPNLVTKKELPNDLKRKLSQAILYEDLVEIEAILSLDEADINLTWFSENLLMCAIRNKKTKISEYFIDKEIDIHFKVKLLEFKEEDSLNSSEYSCRSMAYDNDLFQIVDLIDIFDPNTDPKIVKYLTERYLKENFKADEEPVEESTVLYENRLQTDFVSDTGEKPSIIITNEFESRKKLDLDSELIEQEMHKEADEARPSSNISNRLNNFELPFAKSSTSINSMISRQQTMLDPLRTNKAIIDELNVSLVKKLTEKLEYVNSVLVLAKLSNKRMGKMKCFKYDGFRLDLKLNKSHDFFPPILSSSLGNHVIKPSKEIINLKPHNEVVIKRLLKMPNEIIPPDDLDIAKQNNDSSLNKSMIPGQCKNIKPVIKSDLVIFQYETEQKYYFKETETENNNNFYMNETKFMNKHLPKIKNYYYINSLKRIPAAQTQLVDSLSKYNEPLFPMLIKINDKQEQQSVEKQKIIKRDLVHSGLSRKSSDVSQRPKFLYKTDIEINENYLKSLKKSGLMNKNCKPVVRRVSMLH